MKQMIMVDTSIWIEYFKGNQVISDFMEMNLQAENICITGIIVSELLQGIRNDDERKIIRTNLDAVTYVDLKYDDWISIGELSNKLRKTGITLPLTDIAIAAAVIKNSMTLATFDEHFKHIPELQLYKISSI